MSETKNKRHLSRYDALTTEELEQLLRADVLITDGDEEYLKTIVYIAEVYAKRKKKEMNETTPKPPPDARRPFPKRFIRLTAISAAVIVLVLCGSITAYSMGFDLWGAVAEWTSSLFRFDSPAVPATNADPLESIEQMKPKWLPEGFELVEETITQDGYARYCAIYKNQEKMITLTYRSATSGNTNFFEKTESNVELFEQNGYTFYILNNEERITVSWCANGLVCHIGGNISMDEMKNIIISID